MKTTVRELSIAYDTLKAMSLKDDIHLKKNGESFYKAPIAFTNAIMDNYGIMEKEIKRVNDVFHKPVEGRSAYETDRENLILKHAKYHKAQGSQKQRVPQKDKDGKILIAKENIKAYNEELKELEEKHKDVIKAIKDKRTNVNELLDEEINVQLTPILKSDFPDKMSISQVTSLKFLRTDKLVAPVYGMVDDFMYRGQVNFESKTSFNFLDILLILLGGKHRAEVIIFTEDPCGISTSKVHKSKVHHPKWFNRFKRSRTETDILVHK
jgi:hypothetical protein